MASQTFVSRLIFVLAILFSAAALDLIEDGDSRNADPIPRLDRFWIITSIFVNTFLTIFAVVAAAFFYSRGQQHIALHLALGITTTHFLNFTMLFLGWGYVSSSVTLLLYMAVTKFIPLIPPEWFPIIHFQFPEIQFRPAQFQVIGSPSYSKYQRYARPRTLTSALANTITNIAQFDLVFTTFVDVPTAPIPNLHRNLLLPEESEVPFSAYASVTIDAQPKPKRQNWHSKTCQRALRRKLRAKPLATCATTHCISITSCAPTIFALTRKIDSTSFKFASTAASIPRLPI